MNMSIPKMNKNAVFINFFHVSTANGSIIERLYFCIHFTNISEFVGEGVLDLPGPIKVLQCKKARNLNKTHQQ